MIDYHPGSYQFTFIFSLRGSVLPRAMAYAIPSGVIAILLKSMNLEGTFEGVLTTSAAYSGFSFVVGFLLVFRTSQSYARFWDGATKVQQMKSKWCDAFNSLVAFSRISHRPKEEIQQFQQTLLRLFSLMHSLALQQIHCLHGEGFDVIDALSFDDVSLEYLERVPITSRLEVVSAWVHQIIVDSIDSGLLPVPAPILSRVFQELSNGSVNMENACKIAQTPFPFPYAQMMSVLLLMHWFLTPILMCMWTGHWAYSFVWTFVPVLSFWGINMIAAEIEQPFGDDVNDLPTHDLQRELNATLILLIDTPLGRVPTLKPTATMDIKSLREKHCQPEEPSRWHSAGGLLNAKTPKEAYRFVEQKVHEAESRISHYGHHISKAGQDTDGHNGAEDFIVECGDPDEDAAVRNLDGSLKVQHLPNGGSSSSTPQAQAPRADIEAGGMSPQVIKRIPLGFDTPLQRIDHSRLPLEEPMATIPKSQRSHGTGRGK